MGTQPTRWVPREISFFKGPQAKVSRIGVSGASGSNTLPEPGSKALDATLRLL